YITEVELLSINTEQNLPAGIDERTIIYSLSFMFDFFLDFPQVEVDSIIHDIEISINDNTNQNVSLGTFSVDQTTPVR
ncbi:MAG: hypothetical protein OEZ38_12790, partial [Gammaproteobacteria bacterium]|nr:hypothetical protein [Gammaproteobacteria bacterium]